MVKIESKVRMFNISDVKPYEKNNKKHGETQISLLAEHISSNGWDVPIVVDEDGVIIKGHGRLEAAKKLELKKVPVIVREGLSASQKRAIRIGDNKLAELAEWDNVNLLDEMIALENDEVDVSSLGFSDSEIAKIMALDDVIDAEPHAEEQGWISGQPVIQYNIVFDTKEQQESFYELIKYIKIKYPDVETIGERFEALLKELKNNG